MGTTTEPDVSALLDRLAALVPAQRRDPVEALRARLGERRLRALVVGEAKRGKSTLVNALLGRPALPTGVTPVTALPTIARYGEAERVQVTHQDGRIEARPVGDLLDLVTETRNPDNRLGLTEVLLESPVPLLAGGLELIDTPGVGSVFAHSSAAATTALDTMDAALFVLSADPPVSGSERALLNTVRDRAVAIFCVLNKVDILSAAQRDEVVEFTSRVLADALGHPVRLYQVSARHGTGVAELAADLTDYVREHRSTVPVASIAGHAARLATRHLDEVLLTQRAAQLSTARAAGQVTRFHDRLDTLRDRRRDATDVAQATTKRLLADLNDTTTWDTPRLAGKVRARLLAWLADQPSTGPARLSAARLEDVGRQWVVSEIHIAVDEWRRQREQAIVDGLAAVDTRLAATLDRQIQQVRDAARELLGVELTIPVPAGRLLPEIRVSYAFDEEIGTTLQWEAALRRHLPGRWGRIAVRDHLVDEVDSLVGKQTGRIRSTVQASLRPATTALIRAIETRYAEATSGLLQALAAARDLADSPQAAAGLRDLDTRVAELRGLRDTLTRIREGGT